MSKKLSPIIYLLFKVLSLLSVLTTGYICVFLFPFKSAKIAYIVMYILFFLIHITLAILHYKDRFLIGAVKGALYGNMLFTVGLFSYYVYLVIQTFRIDIMYDAAIFSIGIIEVYAFFQFSTWTNIHEKTNPSDSFGRGKLLEHKDLKKLELDKKPKDPLLLGKSNNEKIFVKNNHTLIVGQSGSGKSSSIIIPNACEREGGHLFLDPKGELFLTLYDTRSQNDRDVYVFDPFDRMPKLFEELKDYKIPYDEKLESTYYDNKVKLNPFDLLSILDCNLNGRNSIQELMDKYVSCIVTEPPQTKGGTGSSQHFVETARMIIKASIYYLIDTKDPVNNMENEPITLSDLYEFLVINKDKDLKGKIQDMIDTSLDAAKAVSNLANVGKEEFGSISSTLSRMIDFLSVDLIRESTNDTEVLWRKLVDGDADLFIIMPDDQIKSQNRLIQLIIYRLICSLTFDKSNDKVFTFVLDEFAQLEYSKMIEEAYPIIRSKGGRFWIIIQNFAQLDIYAQKNLLKDSPNLIFLGTQNQDTIKEVSYLAGEKTVKTENYSGGISAQSSQQSSSSSSANRSTQESKASVLTPEVLRTGFEKRSLALINGIFPFFIDKTFYYADEDYKNKVSVNYVEELDKIKEETS